MQRLPIDTDLFSDQGVSYTVVNSLARPGGTAEAYLVICTSGPAKGIPFAVKLFVSGIEARRQAFTKELEFLRANQHEAILPVYDFGSTVVGVEIIKIRRRAISCGA